MMAYFEFVDSLKKLFEVKKCLRRESVSQLNNKILHCSLEELSNLRYHEDKYDVMDTIMNLKGKKNVTV